MFWPRQRLGPLHVARKLVRDDDLHAWVHQLLLVSVKWWRQPLCTVDHIQQHKAKFICSHPEPLVVHAGRLIDEMRSGADVDTHPGELDIKQITRLHQLLHEAKFRDPDGSHLSPAGEQSFLLTL